MTDLIGEPFTLHGLTVGPSLPEAQLAEGAHGLYVTTLHGWLHLLAAATGDARYRSGDDAGAFGAATTLAVNAVRADAGLPLTGAADTALWDALRGRLAPLVLPPDPCVQRPRFPDPGPDGDVPALLRAGLLDFGFRFQVDETPAAVALFKRLARGPKRGPTGTFTTDSFGDRRFWRKKWRGYHHTWGRLIGAPWLGVVIDAGDTGWGARPLLRDLYAIGRRYLMQARSADELRIRLAAPIHVREIAGRLGEQSAREIRYPGLEPILACTSDLERAAVAGWVQAFDAHGAGSFVTGDASLAGTYEAAPELADGSLPIRVAGSRRTAAALIPTSSHLYETYAQLQRRWDTHFDATDGAGQVDEQKQFLRRTTVFVGGALPAPWRAALPRQRLAFVHGVATATTARALVIARGISVSAIDVSGPGGVRSVPPVDTAPEKLGWLGVQLYRLELAGLQADAAYTVTVRHSTLEPSGAEASTWTLHTLPAAMPPGGIAFVAASCYYDFAIADACGTTARSPGEVYRDALRAWIDHNPSSFFTPRFKVLMGDNVYLDVGPDLMVNQGMVDAEADTLGRYLRYWLCSDYRDVLATLPTFAIPDDHEYWNDYPRSMAFPPRSQGARAALYEDASRVALRAFQGVMAPASLADGEATEFTYHWTIAGGSACPLSCCFFDTSSTRRYKDTIVEDQTTGGTIVLERNEPDRLASPEAIERVVQWAAGLTGPGILILGQPLLVPRYYTSHSLPADYHPSAFPHELRAIMTALATAPWDILVVSGDVHWSRLVELDLAQLAGPLAAGASEAERDAAYGARYRPRLVELISSPAKRLPTQASFVTGLSDEPDFDDPLQIRSTAPWADTPASIPAPRGPRVLGSSYESPTFGAIRCQPIHGSAMRVDLAFVDEAGRIVARDPAAETARPEGALRWCLPGEWIQARPGEHNELWRDYDPGASTRGNARPYYPYGSFDDDELGVLPPMTTGAQLVRILEPGEPLFVKRVLYQARRVERAGVGLEAEYQCIEVATMNPADAASEHGSAVAASYFVWAIYNGKDYTLPYDKHLYSVTLRKRLPWLEAGDYFQIPQDDVVDLWAPGGLTNPQPRARYELGELARAPLTTQRLRWLRRDEKGTVVRVVYQAEQTLIGGVVRGPYQLLEVQMDEPASGPSHGLLWSVLDGAELVRVGGWHGHAPRDERRAQHGLDENLAWLRRGSREYPNQYWAAERLAVLLADPRSLEISGGAAMAGAAVVLCLWLLRAPAGLVELVADVLAFDRYAREQREYEEGRNPALTEAQLDEMTERTLASETRIGEVTLRIPKSIREQPLDGMCLLILRRALERLQSAGDPEGTGVARLLQQALGGSATIESAEPLPTTDPGGTRERVIVGTPGGAFPVPCAHLLSDIVLDGDQVQFTYWPDIPAGQDPELPAAWPTGTAVLDAQAFRAECRVITWTKP